MKHNASIRQAIKDSGLKMYEVAHELGISAGTLTVWLRYDLPEDKQNAIISVLNGLKGER